MATLIVGGISIGNHYKTLEEAVRHANNLDTIVIKKHQLHPTDLIVIDKTLYFEGTNTEIICPRANAKNNPNGLLFFIKRGNVSFKNLQFLCGGQARAMMFDAGYQGQAHFDKVKINLEPKVRYREQAICLQILGTTMQDGNQQIPIGNQGKFVFNNCQLDYVDLWAQSLQLTNTKIGNLFQKSSQVQADSLQMQDVTLSNLYLGWLGTITVNGLKTMGRLTLHGTGNFTDSEVISDLVTKNERLKRKITHDPDFLADLNVGKEPIFPVFTLSGEKKSKMSVALTGLTFEANVGSQKAQAQLPYKLLLFNVRNMQLTLNNLILPLFPYQSLAENATLELNDVQDSSIWQTKQVQLSNRQSQSMLFKDQTGKADASVNGSFGALAELDEMVGLTSVKEQVHQIVNSAKINQKLQQRGLHTKSDDDKFFNMIFGGNPGTGKTVVATLIGKALYEQGVLKTDHIVNIGAEKLVGQVVGESEKNTTEFVNDALDGVLFIDEAYQLKHTEHASYNDAIVNTLVDLLGVYQSRIICIMAGYTDLMREFVQKSNPGIKRRFPYFLEFADYDFEQMKEIMALKLQKGKWHLADDETADAIEQGIKYIMDLTKDDSSAGNGGLIGNILTQISLQQNSRITHANLDLMSDQDLKTIELDDVLDGVTKVEDNIKKLQHNSVSEPEIKVVAPEKQSNNDRNDDDEFA